MRSVLPDFFFFFFFRVDSFRDLSFVNNVRIDTHQQTNKQPIFYTSYVQKCTMLFNNDEKMENDTAGNRSIVSDG